MILLADTKHHLDNEQLYIALRNAEDRIVSDELLQKLPYPDESYRHYNEWKIRAGSFERLMKYLSGKKGFLNILDIGCGNGWLSHKLYLAGHNVTAVDLNLTELEQAEKVFGNNERLHWIYADIFNDNIPGAPFDVILLAASCQYFENINTLSNLLKAKLNKNGSIHLLDSFFYKPTEVSAAKKRTEEYYRSLGFSQMADNYFHHSITALKENGFKKKFPVGIFQRGLPQWWIYQL